jgi:hypothetical protein
MWLDNVLGGWDDLVPGAGSWKTRVIMQAVITAAISIAVIYGATTYLTGNKKRKPIGYFVLFILSVISIFHLGWQLITSLDYIRWSFMLAIVTWASIIAELLAMPSIAVGCIDFCLEANKQQTK